MRKNRQKTGRPTVYTQNLANEICDTISKSTCGIKMLCRKNTHWPSHETIYQWIRLNTEFHDRYLDAKQLQVNIIIDEIIDSSATRTQNKLQIDTLKWLVCKLVPRVYFHHKKPKI